MAARAKTSIADPLLARAPGASFKHPWMKKWMQIVHVIGNIWAWIILSVFFIVILAPVAIIYRCFANPLRLRSRQPAWQALPSQYDQLAEAELQS
jgi:uncharacterized membrane protein